ncbi:hypothetical protein [Streptomyces sp. NBC_01462]|uniref:hypothetical protein n=1 Tax=Streptomyces sp. NBC_01462 TaxID=2903876 RepID=UPI002E31D069|nr:hypothetical protein [Streptomyces sp. NBC_01462]
MTSLAENAATSQDRWPGPLDQVRVGDALFAELLLDLTGRSTAALHPRPSTTEPPSR